MQKWNTCPGSLLPSIHFLKSLNNVCFQGKFVFLLLMAWVIISVAVFDVSSECEFGSSNTSNNNTPADKKYKTEGLIVPSPEHFFHVNNTCLKQLS